MQDDRKRSKKELIILNTALDIMLRSDFNAATKKAVSDIGPISYEDVQSFYITDDALRMAAMEYAVNTWVMNVKEELAREEDPRLRIKKLLRHYVAGPESYGDSLPLYVDLWKRIRDCCNGSTSYLKEKANSIYSLYTDTFIELLCSYLNIRSEKEPWIRVVARVMVVLSDGFHVQALVQGESPEFDLIVEVLYEMLMCYIENEGIE